MRSRRGYAVVWIFALVLTAAVPSPAADHGDGWLELGVVPGLDLAEGPPYPAAAVELAVAAREPISLPAGRLVLTLAEAVDTASASDIPITGTAVDNAQSGEPGDTSTMDVYFVAGPPPNDELPDEIQFEWIVTSDAGADDHTVRFIKGLVSTGLTFTQAETSVSGDQFNLTTMLIEDYGRIDMQFDVGTGQDLVFQSLDATPTIGSSEVSVVFVLRQGASGSVDLAEPLYRFGLTTHPSVGLPTTPGWGIGAAVVLLAIGALVLRRTARRRAARCA